MTNWRSDVKLARYNPASASPGDGLFALELGGRPMPAFWGNSSDGYVRELFPMQPAFFATRTRWWFAREATATPLTFGLDHNTSGNVAARAITTTSLATGTARLGFSTSLSAGSSAGWRHGSAFLFRNPANVAGAAGGFFMTTRFSLFNSSSTFRFFAGVCAQTTALGNTDPSAVVNTMGFAADDSDTNISFICNSSSGTAQKVALPITWPKATLDTLVDLAIYSPRGSNDIGFALRAPGLAWQSVTFTPTKAPAANLLLAPQVYANTPSTLSNNVGFDLNHVIVETDY
jgi:hypothetical protein